MVGPTELATRRVIAIGAAMVAVTVAAAGLLLVLREDDRALPLWFLLLAAVVMVLFIGVGLAAPWLGPMALRVVAGIAAGGYLVQLVAFLPAQAALPGLERVPWMLSASTAAVAAALLAAGSAGAWTVLVVAALAAVGHRLVVGGLDLDGIVNDAQITLAGTVVVVVGSHVLATARALDAAAVAASDATARAASERGRLAARTRAAALVHDEVLATLSLAASGLPVPVDRLAAQASRASGMVAALVDDDPFVRPLAAALREQAQRAGAEFIDRASEPVLLPPPVFSAVVRAAQQSLENSVRHAPAAQRRFVRLRGDGAGVQIDIVDDGAGFDPDAVPADRLGVRSSILGRMREIPGGSATVRSAVGQGTRVRLGWEAPVEGADAAAAGPELSAAGLIVIAVAFVGSQALCAVAAAFATGSWVAPMAVLVALLVAAEILRLSPRAVPSLPRVAVFVAVVVAIVAVGLQAVPFTFGQTWFTVAGSFLLVALALRRRPASALAGIALLVAAVAATGIGAGATVGEVALLVARPIALVCLAVALLVGVERMQQRIVTLHRRSVETTRQAVWDAARRAELAARAVELDARVLPVLRVVAAGAELSAAQRGMCAALEGELRDEYRAGGLAREPLVQVVRRIRSRGVDVLLLDDADDAPEDAELEAIAVWMAEAITPARVSAVGRLLPAGRAERATVTVDGETTGFRG